MTLDSRSTWSRRRFLAAAGAASASAVFRPPIAGAQSAPLTVDDVVARVLRGLGEMPPVTNTVDGLKAGRADQRVTGIVVTPLATLDVLTRAAAGGRNLIVTFEPAFYARADQPSPANRAADPVFAAKRAAIDQHALAVWRLHDRWMARTPDRMVAAFVDALGWRARQDAALPHRVAISPMTLGDLAAYVEQRLGARALRIVGDRSLRVSTIALSPGASAPAVTFTNLPVVDAIIAGESREWEGVEYTQDAIAAGGRKALLIVGRVLSENAGVKALADFIRTTVPGVPVEFAPIADPYWRPMASMAGRGYSAPLSLASPAAAAPRVTAQQVVDRVKQTLAAAGVAWRAETVDTFKAGDPNTPVRGIATAFMATFDTIRRAVEAGANFVISHEPTFYNHQDATAQFENDATFKAKMAFIREHEVVVFRFHDHWHARRPDGMRVAILKALGWPDAPGTVTLPATTLGALAEDIASKLGVRAMRVVGDPAAPVSRVAVGLGYGNPQLNDGVDAVVTGEAQEADSAWDNASYAIDAGAAGHPKGWVLLGHEQSETRGMDECASWLRTIVPEVPITFVRSGEPFA